jgi:hypothetical protein
MPARKPKPVTLRRAPIEIAAPAKAGPGQSFVIETFAEKSVGQSKRYRNIGDHPLSMAWHKGQLSDEQYIAGNTFFTLYATINSSGRDSTQALEAGRCSGGSSDHLDRMVSAGADLNRIETAMGARNYRIVANFCGKAMPMTEAVQRVVACHPNGIRFRMSEALEDLSDALDSARIQRIVDLPRGTT